MNKIYYLLALLPYLGYAHDHTTGEEEKPLFHWTQEKMAAANILAQVAGPGMIQRIVPVSGKIAAHPDNLAIVMPKIEGTVQAIYKNVGDSVEKGEVIALLESQEMAAAKAAYLTAEKKAELQQLILQREANLRRISAEKDYLEAKLAAEEALVHAQVALQHLYALGLTEADVRQVAQESPEKFRYYQIRSPLSGKIFERDLTLGEHVGASCKIFRVANFDKVWVELHVAANDAHYLKEGLPIEIIAAHHLSTSAQLSHFNPTISEETRKATAIAVLDNSEGIWKPGEFITAHLETEKSAVSLVVPKEAVQLINGESCLFIEDGETGFCPCNVKLGKMDRANVEILSGLQPGVKFAATNTFTLKADYEKEEGEHHH